MIAEVEARNVGAVIVKDMSHFGRDYLKVGFYTEVMFKEKGVRFIAINNGIDSANQHDSDFTPFLNRQYSRNRPKKRYRTNGVIWNYDCAAIAIDDCLKGK